MEVRDEELNVKNIIAVIDVTFAVAKESLKKFRLVRDFNP